MHGRNGSHSCSRWRERKLGSVGSLSRRAEIHSNRNQSVILINPSPDVILSPTNITSKKLGLSDEARTARLRFRQASENRPGSNSAQARQRIRGNQPSCKLLGSACEAFKRGWAEAKIRQRPPFFRRRFVSLKSTDCMTVYQQENRKSVSAETELFICDISFRCHSADRSSPIEIALEV